MAILSQKTELLAGQQLTSITLNDISETAVAAYIKAQEATILAQEEAKACKDYAKSLIDEAIGNALNSGV